MATKIISKRCSKCKRTKSVSQFYKRQTAKSGCDCYCKVCQKVYNKIPKIKIARQIAVKRYQRTPKGKIAKDNATKRFLQSGKSHSKKYRLARYLRCQKRRIENPLWHQTMNRVNNAIRRGKLPKPSTLTCENCGNQAAEYHHYRGYEVKHQLTIMPLCVKCHRNIHSKLTNKVFSEFLF